MSEQVSVKPVYIDSTPRSVRQAGLWDWVAYYVYNLWRKPGVWWAKRKLLRLAVDVTTAVRSELLPKLERNRFDCAECRDAYMALNGQPFVSNIRMILRRMQCADHFEIFNAFLNKYRSQFDQSEDVSAWICGFKR